MRRLEKSMFKDRGGGGGRDKDPGFLTGSSMSGTIVRLEEARTYQTFNGNEEDKKGINNEEKILRESEKRSREETDKVGSRQYGATESDNTKNRTD